MTYGIDQACQQLQTSLALLVPEAIAALGMVQAVAEPGAIFAEYHAPESLGAGDWPVVMIDPIRLVRRWSEDIEPGVREWWARYQIRVVVYARSLGDQDYAPTATAVRTLITAVRLALESDLTLGTGTNALFPDPISFTESYSGMVPDDDSRTVGAAFLEFQMNVHELQPLIVGTPPAILGVAATVSGGVTHFPIGTALSA